MAKCKQEKIEEIRDEVLKLLENFREEWEGRYAGYIDRIPKITNRVKKNRSIIRMPQALSLYSSISANANKINLRFYGQRVGNIVFKNDSIVIEPYVKTILRDFDEKFEESLDCKKNDGGQFKSFFKRKDKNPNGIRLHSPEHRVENRMLKYFKDKSKRRDFRYGICPVVIHDCCFFQMPTPLKASDHKQLPTYAKQYGGGIDILARVGIAVGVSRLCVMEVKDQNVNAESQADAMGQAVAYAVFIAKLLRSQSGQAWYNFFMGRDFGKVYPQGDVPQELHIDVVTVMPQGNTDEFCNEDLDVSELKTTLHCHTLYFDDEEFNKGKGEIVFTEKSTYLNKVKK